ncbi:kinase-like domain-containing protein [Chiua virens]|nr:kinase-like domain-containing protein [Chiua virens]
MESGLDNNRGDFVPLLGIAKGLGPLYSIVSAWMPSGTLHSFLKNAGKEYSFGQRVSILHGIGSCLEYLHSNLNLRGNITSNNILIDEKRNPHLTDIGLSSAYFLRRSINPGALRWAAPELFDDECKPKLSTNVYSFGCVMLEVLSGKIPWDGKPESVVIRVSELHAQHEEYLLRILDKFNISSEHWTQEPKYHTSRRMDLTRKVSF